MSGKDQKLTVMLSGSKESGVKTYTVSKVFLRTVFLSCLCIVLGAIALLGDYFNLLSQSGRIKLLRTRNEALNTEVKNLKSELEKINNQLSIVDEFSAKLELITDIQAPSRELDLKAGINSINAKAKIEKEDSKKKVSLGFGEGKSDSAKQNGEPKTLKEQILSGTDFFSNPLLPEVHSESLTPQQLAKIAKLKWDTNQVAERAVDSASKVVGLWGKLSQKKDLLLATPSILPARGWLTSRFGYRSDPFTGKPTMHSGLDIAAMHGTPVVAASSGIVSYVGYEAGYGKIVTIDHGYGVSTRYAHNSELFVKVGQKVKRREKIAAVGSTGRSSGPHLHYEVRVEGVPVDPENYILEKSI